MSDHPTDTSRWCLAIHRVTSSTVQLWVGTLFSSMSMPDRARVRLENLAGKTLRTSSIARGHWKRPFAGVKQRFFTVRDLSRLEPARCYRVFFEREVTRDGKRSWQLLRDGEFETLPTRVPAAGARPFTVALASCFYDHRDGGQAAAAYKGLYGKKPSSSRPHVTFLTGDQVYLDIGFDSLSPVTREIRERVADDYAKHWRSLGSILTRGGTWMLPDDHEYWNDYPYFDGLIPTLLMLKVAKVRRAWQGAARDGVRHVQRSPVVDTFQLGNDLSFCLADLRSFRGTHRGEGVMMHPDSFPRLLDWACELTCPGVLVISQPLLVEKSNGERNLRSFPGQYRQLMSALGHSGHDVIVLSGDVHFGRIATASLGPRGGRLIEIISSPLSNLTGLSGISTATPKLRPARFPPASVSPWPNQKVTYNRDFTVKTLGGSLTSPYPAARTKEHFMTVSFSRAAGQRIRLAAQSWQVRERRGALPVKGFPRSFTTLVR